MKVLLTTHNHLGDAVCLTAAIHAAKEARPDVELDYEGRYADVFKGNPDVTPFDHSSADLRVKVTYHPHSQRRGDGGNLCEGYGYNLCSLLGCADKAQRTPRLFLAEEERRPLVDCPDGYCVINANVQTCSRVKAWPYWQNVIDAHPGLAFVQVGGDEPRDVTRDLRNVIDLRGKTDVRALIRLISRARYVISPPSAAVHIAAAFPAVKCIVISGAREPSALTDYPNAVHLSSRCGKWSSGFGCMKFNLGNGGSKFCAHALKVGDCMFTNCMAAVSPEEVSSCLN